MRRQMEVTSAWTGEKKTKIQSTPTSACGDIGEAEEDDASAMIIVQEGPEQLEGLDWDQEFRIRSTRRLIGIFSFNS